MRKNNTVIAVIGLILLSLGFWIGYLISKINMPKFAMSNEGGIEINPFDPFALLVNLLLAVYVISTLNREYESSRIIRNTLIEEFSIFSRNINTELSKIQSGTIMYSDAASLFKSLLTKHTELYKWYQDTNIEVDKGLKAKIFDKIKHVRNLITADTHSLSGMGNTVTDNIISISPGVLIQVELEKNIILHELFKVKLDLNKI